MIALSEPSFIGNELKYLKKCIESGMVSSIGHYVDLFEKKIAKYTGSKYAVACINGTSALQISLKLCGVKNNDEVIAPSLTFVATINAIKYNRGNPIFMDVDEFFNIDENKTIEFILNNTYQKKNYCINKKTNNKIKAIIVAHMYGNAASIDKLYTICKKKNIKIVEDAAESLGSRYLKSKFKNKHTGTIGEMGAVSFNGNKIITSGGGGMVLTNNKCLMKKAKYYTTQAKNPSKSYLHDDVGFNFRLSNIQSAVGLAQLEKLNKILMKKKKINQIYYKYLKNVKGVELTKNPNYSFNNCWINILLLKNNKKNKLMRMLNNKNIQVRPVWYPNHLQKMFTKNQTYRIEKSVSLFQKAICLPSSYKLSEKNINYICNLIKKC